MLEENNDNYILTIEEACEQLKVGKSVLYQLLRSHQLKAFKIGRVWKITQRNIYDFINNQSL